MLDARCREAGRFGLDDEGAHPLAATRLRIGQREDADQVRDRSVGDESLAAVQDVVIAVTDGAHPVGGDVAAGGGLGQPEGGQPLAGGEAREVAVLLLLVAGQQDRQGAELLNGGDQAGGRVGARDLLDEDGLRDLVEGRPAVALREARAEQVLLREELLEVPGELLLLVDLGGTGCDPLRGELAHDGAQLVVIGGRQVRHSAPRAGVRGVGRVRV